MQAYKTQETFDEAGVYVFVSVKVHKTLTLKSNCWFPLHSCFSSGLESVCEMLLSFICAEFAILEVRQSLLLPSKTCIRSTTSKIFFLSWKLKMTINQALWKNTFAACR